MRRADRSFTTRRPGGKAGPKAQALVLVAMFAMLVQLLLPSAVMAAQPLSQTMTICAPGQPDNITQSPDPTHKSVMGLPCASCLAVAGVALPTPEIGIVRAIYTTATVEFSARRPAQQRGARAPPRPPGQGPPAVNA